MKYVQVKWIHDFLDEPMELYSEQRLIPISSLTDSMSLPRKRFLMTCI